MATLAELLGLDIAKVLAILVGAGEPTNFTSSTGEPYFLFKLKSPIMVGCSMDPEIQRFETDEVYVRQGALTDPELVKIMKVAVEGKPLEGFWFDKWVVDFSLGQKIPIYQETTIRQWTKDNRSVRKVQRTTDVNAGIRAKIKAKAEETK